jgi:hypothetical protein
VIEDWPLAQEPSLGLGPHLVVQVDDGPGERIGDWHQGESGSGRLNLAMAALAPGSHRITVYAALPWGEAVKLPGASAQLRVDRVAANPVSQPAPGSAQLLAISPDALSQSEPVLIDWLLRDAPLQGLREGDARWRLRISVNGDSFLVDQNTPLWLRGLKRGSNALLLELLDGLGEPLNPPFNSLVREVVIEPGAARPIWLNEHLSATDLARLLGEMSPLDTPPPERAVELEQEADADVAAGAQANAGEEGQAPLATSSGNDPGAGREESRAEPSPEQPAPEPMSEPVSGPVPDIDRSTETEELAVVAPPSPAEPMTQPPRDAAPIDTRPADRIQPGTRLSGSARELVREDGSLIPERQPGPLRGLGARLRP